VTPPGIRTWLETISLASVKKKDVIDGKYSFKKNKNEKKEGVQYQVWGRVDCSSGNRLGE
jgi:hypothetical protein